MRIPASILLITFALTVSLNALGLYGTGLQESSAPAASVPMAIQAQLLKLLQFRATCVALGHVCGHLQPLLLRQLTENKAHELISHMLMVGHKSPP